MTKITASVTFSDDKLHMRLLFAFLACHDLWSHDRDEIIFRRDDGKAICINKAIGYVSFGPNGADETDTCWTENIDSGFCQRLLTSFIYGPSCDDNIEKMDWICRYGQFKNLRPASPDDPFGGPDAMPDAAPKPY